MALASMRSAVGKRLFNLGKHLTMELVSLPAAGWNKLPV